ncbi:MAG: NHL repeat-containing protein, partial [Acidobacteria bacterium]|nr:NHL repeat-containing protein [Acidobacteriota bacterium]
YVNHGILIAGRRLFYGHPYYAWGAGYPTTERDKVYKQMFESRNAAEVYRLIKENGITYVAIDDALRKSDFVRNLNERIFERFFPVVFEDTERRYDNLKVYLVPPDLDLSPDAQQDLPPPLVTPAANALEGGEGTGGGQFVKPRGINKDAAGNFYVADTGNSRVQKFSPDGLFLLSIGNPGAGIGQLREPNAVAIDSEGRIYVVDALNHKLLRFDAGGNFDQEWRGPEPGFYGPRDIMFGPNEQLYIVDQGRTRIVRFDPLTEEFTAWGRSGSGPGQFLESTGIAIGGNQVFICDLGNNRIQVFDLEGNFIRMWGVPDWGKYPWHYPDAALDERAGRLYVTNGWKNELLAFDLNGNSIEARFERPPVLSNPSSLVLIENRVGRRLFVLNTDGARVETVRLPPLTAR